MKKDLTLNGSNVPASNHEKQAADANSKTQINRRKFVKMTTTGALAFSIIPRHVLGGSGFTAPSDKLTIAYIGCGTQGFRELLPLLAVPGVQVVAVCDPNKD